MKRMKRTMLTMLAAVTMMTGASAQKTERLAHIVDGFYEKDSVVLDSMYNYWNDFVAQHPKDEIAWRNLFEVTDRKVFCLGYKKKDWKSGEDLRKQLNVVGRMEKAIPNSYTFYYCAYQDNYKPGLLEKADADKMYADSAIAKLPDDSWSDDYELWIQYLIPQRDTIRMVQLLKRYYESGQYPEESLQYHFNELQGMNEGGVYIGPHPGGIIGKFILQYVLGVHKDKVLYDEDAAMNPDYVKDVFGHIGIPFDDKVWNQLHNALLQDQTLRNIMHYIFDHSERPVYLSAHDIWVYNLSQGLSDDIKACLYNEGLTMRYSAKPYDNRSVKRRNIEQRYRLEYLRMPFHPEVRDTRRYEMFSGSGHSMNYIRLLHDQLPYYKQHNPERYQWLTDIFNDIIRQLEKRGYDVNEFKGYLK